MQPHYLTLKFMIYIDEWRPPMCRWREKELMCKVNTEHAHHPAEHHSSLSVQGQTTVSLNPSSLFNSRFSFPLLRPFSPPAACKHSSLRWVIYDGALIIHAHGSQGLVLQLRGSFITTQLISRWTAGGIGGYATASIGSVGNDNPQTHAQNINKI